jgi:hypothetical protein
MKKFMAYAAAIVGWLFVSFAVTFLGGVAAVLIYHRDEFDLAKLLVLAVVAVGVILLGAALVRWGRTALDRPGGSAVGRAVLALILFSLAAWTLVSPPDASSQWRKDYDVGVAVAAIVLGGVLVLEAAWHRSSRGQTQSVASPGR